MSARPVLAAALLALVFYGCGSPIPAAKSEYGGDGRGQDMWLLITGHRLGRLAPRWKLVVDGVELTRREPQTLR